MVMPRLLAMGENHGYRITGVFWTVLNIKTSLADFQLFIYLFAFAKFGAHSMTFIGSRPATDCPAGPAVTRRGRVSRDRLNDVTPNRPDTTLPDTKIREQIEYAARCHARGEINIFFQINDTIKIRTNRAHAAHARGSFFPQIALIPSVPVSHCASSVADRGHDTTVSGGASASAGGGGGAALSVRSGDPQSR